MGLYTGEPGRDPAVETPARFAEAREFVERMRGPDSTPESAEWVLRCLAPLLEEFFDHAALREWERDAAGRLAAAYRVAGLTETPEGVVGLHEARLNLKQAIETPTPEAVVRAELAFKHELHRAPACTAALDGLKRLGAVRPLAPAAPARPTLSAREQLEVLARTCQWPERTRDGVCTGCRWPDRTTLDGKPSVEGCRYRKAVVSVLSRAAGRRFPSPEGPAVLAAYEAAPPEVRARLDVEITALFGEL